jgi:hypothetical protein
MAARKKKSLSPEASGAVSQCRYFEATVAACGSGDVTRGAEISKQAAIDRRQSGDDVVVWGPDPAENRREASDIETAASGVGNVIRHGAHGMAGANALNHYQAITPPPRGHTFYETKSQKAK